MKNAKKVLALLLSLALVVVCAACAAPTNDDTPITTTTTAQKTKMNVYVLAGPTGIGAVNLRAKAEAGTTQNDYAFTMTSANDEIVAAVSQGKADIAAVATNMASSLYKKTEGKVTVLAVNTLGVLSILAKNGETFETFADLRGKTIIAPGQGANPEYVLRWVLRLNGLDPDVDVNIQFVSDGSELAGAWAQNGEAVVMAPQPVATSLLMNVENAQTVFDMTEEWNKVSEDDALMMGCVIVQNEFLANNKAAVDTFLQEYKASIEEATKNIDATAQYCETYGIIPKAALAKKAIPSCGLTYVDGAEMKEKLSGYLEVMYAADPKSVGGALPGDDFYYNAG